MIPDLEKLKSHCAI